MKLTLLTLASALLLPTLASAADPDPVRLSFERDLVREPIPQESGPALAQEDALTEAIQAALYPVPQTKALAASSPVSCTGAVRARKGG